jgi:formylglycine-generating enzyme required for sulfatase activity
MIHAKHAIQYFQRHRFDADISKGIVLMLIFFVDQLQAQSPKENTNSIGMKLVLIPKGTFMMGSPESEQGHQKDENQHWVTISKDYYLSVRSQS